MSGTKHGAKFIVKSAEKTNFKIRRFRARYTKFLGASGLYDQALLPGFLARNLLPYLSCVNADCVVRIKVPARNLLNRARFVNAPFTFAGETRTQ